MGLFDRFKKGLQKTKNNLVGEIRRIVTRSPKLTGDSLEELEMALIGADFGMATTQQVVAAAKEAFQTQGKQGLDILDVAIREIESSLSSQNSALNKAPEGLTVVSLVGVNGTGKTTTAARLAHRLKEEGKKPFLAACDTFRAAAIDQLILWSERLDVPIVAGKYGSDPASVAHDAVANASSKGADYLLIDTAGRLHTKHNLMQELGKLHRVVDKKLPGAPHETLLVIDATTGMNAMVQAREFNRITKLTGIVVTKLDGTSKGGMVVAIQRELGIPIKFIGLGEQPEDLQPFDPRQFAEALFSE